jgi:GT2 family glycosyltransferase
MAGGVVHFVEDARGRTIVDFHEHYGASRAKIAPTLRRRQCEQVEFHCMLVRRDALERLLPFDEELLSLAEHTDFCLRAGEAGGTVWFEPTAVVTYVTTRWLAANEKRFFRMRWSDDWNRRSIAHFADKWRLRRDDPWRDELFEWGATRRCFVSTPGKVLRVLLGPDRGYAMARRLDRLRDEQGLVGGLLGRRAPRA